MGLNRITVPASDESEIAVDRKRDLGELQELLLLCCPLNEGRRSIPVLARHMQRSPQSLYRHIRNKTLPAWVAKECCTLSEGRVSLKKFAPYVFRDTR